MSESEAFATGAVRTRLSARPPAMRGQPYAWLAIFVAFMIAFRFIPPWDNAQAYEYNQWLYFSVLVVGFYFIFGLSGQFAFSQAAFAMVGGYTSAWATRQGIDLLLAVPIGIFAACVIAFVFSYIARKANLFFLAIATLALSELIVQIIRAWEEFVGQLGGDATLSETQRIEFFGWKLTSIANPPAVEQRNIFWVYLISLAIVMLIGIWLARSPAKREAMAMRDQPTVAATLGVPTTRVRIVMFVLGSGIGAFAGCLFVHGRGYVQTDIFSIELGLGIFVMLIVGGIDSLWGPVLGAAFYVWVPHILLRLDINLFGKEIRNYNQILYGVTLLLAMIFAPQGIVGLFRQLTGRLRHQPGEGSRSWLTDFFGLTKPPLVEEPVAEDDEEGTVDATIVAGDSSSETADAVAADESAESAESAGDATIEGEPDPEGDA